MATSTRRPRTRKPLPGAFVPDAVDVERSERYGFEVRTTEGPASAAVRASRSSDIEVRDAGLAYLAAMDADRATHATSWGSR